MLKYDIAKLHVLKSIADSHLRPGDLLPAQSELLEHDRFSLICLKRAFADLENAGIIKKSQGKRATLLREVVKTDYIGSVVFVYVYRNSPAVNSGIYLLRDQLAKSGIDLKILAVNDPHQDLSEHFANALGIILMGSITKTWLAALKPFRLPAMIIGTNPFIEQISSFGYDWEAQTAELCERLRQRGAKRIALINGAKRYYPAKQIYKVVKDFAKKHNSTLPEDFYLWCKMDDIEYKQRMISALFARADEYDAVIVEKGAIDMAPLLALGMNLPKRIQLGIMLPEDTMLKNVSFDNIVLTGFNENIFLSSARFVIETLEQGYGAVPKQIKLAPVFYS